MTTPTFAPPLDPSALSDKPVVRVLTAEFGDGYTQNTAPGLNNVRRVLNLEWEVLTHSEADAIVNFLKARQGAELFLWTSVHESTALKWTCDEWTDKHLRAGFRTISATFKQSFVL